MAKQNTSFPHGFAAFCIFCCYPLPLIGIGTACQYHVRMRLIGKYVANRHPQTGQYEPDDVDQHGSHAAAILHGLTERGQREPRHLERLNAQWNAHNGDAQHQTDNGRFVDGDWLHTCRPAELRHHHRYSVRYPVVQDGQISAMAVRLANPQLVNHFRSLHPA